MEMYYEQGINRKDCELKIAEKYKRPFTILSEKEIRIGGFWGLFSKPGTEVGFYFSPPPQKNPYYPGAPVSWPVSDVSLQYSRNAPVDLEEEKRKVIAAAGKSYDQVTAGRESAQKILESLINEIKEKERKVEHPAFARAAELLKLNDFSQGFIDKMLERMRKELPLETLDDEEALQDRLLEFIGEGISIYKEDSRPRKPKIMVLIGPTGVGKTTTVSKLAAIYGIGTEEIDAVNVRMITIDAFRIGAQEQLEKTGNIMQIPVTCVDNKHSLRKEIALYSEEIDLFLIDTIGKSPKDSSKLGEMKEILEGCGKQAEYHLVVSAGTKASDIEEIMRQFEPFNYRSVIITKMDETDHIGNVISAISEKRKPVSYITDGQKMPGDIKKASVVRFLINLDSFKIDREKIENRFPPGEAEQFNWS